MTHNNSECPYKSAFDEIEKEMDGLNKMLKRDKTWNPRVAKINQILQKLGEDE